jgi:hypothetical protein
MGIIVYWVNIKKQCWLNTLLNLFEPSFHNNLFCYNLLFQLKKNDKNCFKINSIRILFGFNGKNTLKSWKFEDLKKTPAKQLFFILNCTIYIWSVSVSRVLSIGKHDCSNTKDASISLAIPDFFFSVLKRILHRIYLVLRNITYWKNSGTWNRSNIYCTI